MVAALNQDRLAQISPVADVPDDIDECYMSLDIDSADLQRYLTSQWQYIGAVNTIREMSRALVAAGIQKIRFAPDNPEGSFRNADTLHVSIFDLERVKFGAFLKKAGIDVSKTYDSPADELRASLARRERRREVRDNERLAKQRGHVARYTVRKYLGRTCDIEFIDDKKTQFVVVDAEGKYTLYVGRISERPTFTVEIYKAKLMSTTNGQIVYKGRAEVVFSDKVRDILEGVEEDD